MLIKEYGVSPEAPPSALAARNLAALHGVQYRGFFPAWRGSDELVQAGTAERHAGKNLLN